jgi:tripartite-type tricarboxylate transporter receptor subunit TctC
MVPAGTPKPIIDKMAAEIGKALKSSMITQRFAQDDAVAGQGGPDAFAAFIRKEQARWEEVVKRAGIVIE